MNIWEQTEEVESRSRWTDEETRLLTNVCLDNSIETELHVLMLQSNYMTSHSTHFACTPTSLKGQ